MLGILCGVDIIEIDRVKKSIEKTGKRFKDMVFTSGEIEYCEERKAVKYKSYAARFAAKEAVSKAIGTGFSQGVNWKDIEVVNDGQGKPFVVLHGKAKELLELLDACDVSISLSHCEEYAVAYAVIQTKT